MKYRAIKIFFFGLALSFFAMGCTVTHTYLKDGYKKNEKQWLKRVALAIDASAPPGSLDVSRLYLDMAAHEVSLHGEYLITRIRRAISLSELPAYCKAHSDLDGVIIHRFTDLEGDQETFHLTVQASLLDCRRESLVWEARGGKSFDREDSDLSRMIASYRSRYGGIADQFAAPFYGIIRKLYDSLPDPTLVDEDLQNKVELDAVGPAWE